MREGIGKSLCLLALLFVFNRADDAVSLEDLKTGFPEEDSKSAALSSAYTDADSLEDDSLNDTPGSSLGKAAASAGAYSTGGQASAQATAQSGVQDSLLRPSWMSPGSSGSAIADARAQASGGINGLQPLPYQPGYDSNQYGSSSQAQAEAMASSGLGSGNLLGSNLYGSGNSYPLLLGSGSSSAQAYAESQALVNSAGGGFYPGLNYLPGSGLSSAQAQAQAQAQVQAQPQAQAQTEAQMQNTAGYGSVFNPYQQFYQQPNPLANLGQGSSESAQAQAQAQAKVESQLNGGNLLGPSYPGYQYPIPLYPGGSLSTAQAGTQAISGGSGNAEVNAQAISNAQDLVAAGADAYTRVIPFYEYIMPQLIPGAVDKIACQMEGQLHYLWSPAFQCLVCTCIRQLGVLIPVCVKCDGCVSPTPGPVPIIPPQPILPPEPIFPPVTVAPSPPTVPVATCNPLPSGQPFQNPLNPCQICICRETLNWQGELDVHIECQQNPDCVIPTDVSTLSPVPVGPVPEPVLVCDKYPTNVVFPHPMDVCKVCKCTLEPNGLGIVEPRIICITIPECQPRPLPVLPTPPPEPITLPLIPVTPDPIPWPPVTTPAPVGPIPGPGPLPGPSPHESCRPYAPNTPFQHPWDECQVCLCTEAYSYGRITIEVNCYTKKSCCYEPPYIEPVTIAPGPYPPAPTIQIIDKICEYRSLGVEFLSPVDGCALCTCELQGSLVVALCRPFQAPGCTYYTGGGSSISEAQATASALAGVSGSQSQASAEANTISQNTVQPGLPLLPVLQPWLQTLKSELQPWLQPGYPQLTPGQGSQYYPGSGWGVGQLGGSQASASALAETQTNLYQVPGFGKISPFNQLLPSVQGNAPNINWLSGGFLPEAAAVANAIQESNLYLGNNPGTTKLQPYYPGGNQLGNLGGNQLGVGSVLGSSALAEAEASANSNALTPSYGLLGGNLGNLGSLGIAENLLGSLGGQFGGDGYNTPLANPGSYGLMGGGGIPGVGSSALAEAEATSNALSPGSYGVPGSNLRQGNLASAEAMANAQSIMNGGGGGLYPGGSPLNLYQNPYLMPGYQTSSSQAKATATSNSQGQASANAIAKQGKSAQDDFESMQDDLVK